MRWASLLVALAVSGCVPEVARLNDCNTQRCKKVEDIQLEFADEFVEAAVKSEEPLPEFVVPLVEKLLVDTSDEVEGIAKNASALQTWHGMPEEPVEAGSPGERRDRMTLPAKAKARDTAIDFGRKKLGMPPRKTPEPVTPTSGEFPWKQVLGWGVGAVASVVAGKEALDVRRRKYQNLALTKAIARARKNGSKKDMQEALTGDDVPAEEIAATRAAHEEAKALGEV